MPGLHLLVVAPARIVMFIMVMHDDGISLRLMLM